MREKIYRNISAEAVHAEEGRDEPDEKEVIVNVYGSESKYPFLVLPDMEAIRRMHDFLARVIEQEEAKKR